MQIAKILFWINVNLCSSTTGGPVAWRCPLPACTGTIMPGEDDISPKNASQKYSQKNCLVTKSSFSGLPWTPWRLPTTRPQPSTWIIHPGRTPHPNCDKVAIPCQKIPKSRSYCNCPPRRCVPGAWFGHSGVFCAIRPWTKNASISEVYQRNKSEKLASIDLTCSFKFSFSCCLGIFRKRTFRLHVCTELR